MATVARAMLRFRCPGILAVVDGTRSDDTVEADLEPAFIRILGDQILRMIASYQIPWPKRCHVAGAAAVSPTDAQRPAAHDGQIQRGIRAQVMGRQSRS